MSTHRSTQRVQPFRQITENDALIWWLGGLQGRRTAVHDAGRNSASEESSRSKEKEAGYSRKMVVALGDEAKGEGR